MRDSAIAHPGDLQEFFSGARALAVFRHPIGEGSTTDMNPLAQDQLLPAISPIAEDVISGLSSSPKCLSPRLFYDAAGSELFEQITELPEYYLTRTERGILSEHAGEMLKQAGD